MTKTVADDYDIVAPAAGPMIESMRAHGYSLATAIADLVDNSISAQARNVWINFHWAGEGSHVSILDDGNGMDEITLRDAMRLGSKSPLEERSLKDLGRFGLGLKTASFSQSRRLTVASRRSGGGVVIRRWDLDHVLLVNDWQLLKLPAQGAERLLLSLDQMEQGTIVLWENIDRVIEKGTTSTDSASQARFLRMVGEVQCYLAMVFHRYLEGLSPRLKIFINGISEDCQVQAWDPYMKGHPATFSTPIESVILHKGEILIQGFVLPHKDKLSPDELEYAAGLNGWNAQQGFYVYRNQRMLVGGGWLGLGSDRQWTQEEHYKLARILVEIPNSQDLDWQIDVKKSTAKPPAWLRDRLKVLGDKVRKQAREVFAHRGSYGNHEPQAEIVRAWVPKTIKGRLVYRIDRSHPLIKAASIMALTVEQKKIFNAMLLTLEETLPVARIWLDTAERPEAHGRPFETIQDLEKRHLVEITYRAWREIHGLDPETTRQKLRETDGFQDFNELIDALKD